MKKYIGADIGGTFIKLGIVSSEGTVSMKRELPISRGDGAEPVMDTLINGIDELIRKSVGTSTEFEGIGVSSAGCVDSRSGAISHNGGRVPGWANTDVAAVLKNRFSMPVTLVNDGNAVALAESRFGAAAGCSDVVCIVLGTGVGGGIISGGKLIEGLHGFGGEVGHFPTHAEKKPDTEGAKASHYENFSATSALVGMASEKNPEWTDGRRIFDAAQNGNADALGILDKWIDEIAAGLAGFIHIFNPEMIIIGGGVSQQEELLIKPLREKVLSIIMPDFAEGLEIRGATLGNNAGMVGAVRYFMEHSFSRGL